VRPARLLFHRTHVVLRGPVAFRPSVASSPAHPVLAAELRHVRLPALSLVPALFPIQYELHPLLHRVRRSPGHRSVLRDVAVQWQPRVKDVVDPKCLGSTWSVPCQRCPRFGPLTSLLKMKSYFIGERNPLRLGKRRASLWQGRRGLLLVRIARGGGGAGGSIRLAAERGMAARAGESGGSAVEVAQVRRAAGVSCFSRTGRR